MMILSNCLSATADEGCLKVANSLIRRIKQARPETMVVAYGDPSQPGDLYLPVNKLMLNGKLLRLLRQRKEPLLYVPAVAKAHTMAARLLILSLFARKGIRTVVVMGYDTGTLSRLLLKLSGARLITLSRDTWQYYRGIIGDRAEYLKTGVDTEKFRPVTEAEKRALREKYGLPQDKPIVLHVGHLKAGRNVGQLLNLEKEFHGVLVASTYAAEQKDAELKAKLSGKGNITVLDGYLPHIEELYQLADVYLFPVVKAHNCIDTPLSALEAAACGLPVVTTPYGEMKELLGCEGFYEIGSLEKEPLNALLRKACRENTDPRRSVLEYDWNIAVKKLLANNPKEEQEEM